MRFPLACLAWPLGPREAAAHDSGIDGRGDGREKGPMQATSGPQRDKTLPARPKTLISAHFSRAGRTFYRFRHQQPEQGELYPACRAASGTKLSQQAALAGPPGTKLSQRAPKCRFRAIFRMQGELFTASATNTTSRENFIPHAGPLPVQNSPSKPGSAAHPVQNSPSEPQNADFGPLFACRENFVPLPPPTTRAGRKSHAPTPHRTPTTCPSPNFACNSIE